MIKRGRTLTGMVMALFLVFMPVAANAQTASLTCNSDGTMTQGTEFYDSGTSTGACQNQGLTHIVSQVICNYIGIMNDVVGKVYCSMQYSLVNVLEVVLILYIAIFGVQILMGMTQLNAREIVTRFFKIALIWVFATEATWGVARGFNFFVAVISDGVFWVVNPVATAAGIGVSIPTSGSSMPIYAYLDSFVQTAIFAPFMAANFKLVGFFVIMAHIFPTIALMAAMWFWQTLMTIASIMVAFLISITAIAFLIVVSPIFLSFMLFQFTYHFFDNWLRFMMAYCLQIVIVFAIAAMWIMVTIQFISFFNNVADLIYPYQQSLTEGEVQTAENDLAWCKPQDTTDIMGPEITCAPGTLIPPDEWDEQADYIYYLFYHLISLLLVATAFKVMIKNAPQLANSIVSPGLVPPLLAGGWGTPGLLNKISAPDKPTLDSRQKAFSQQAGAIAKNFANRMQENIANRPGGKKS